MAYQETNVDLIINRLTKAQYEKALEANQINDKELYFITDDLYYTKDEIDGKGFLNASNLAGYATVSYVNDTFQAKGNYLTKESADTFYQPVGNYLTEHQSLANYYTKSEVDGKLGSVYKYKGSVANFDSLPTSDVNNGDVYNTEDTGDNYAYVSETSSWDKLGGTINLDNYATKEELFSKDYNDLTNKPTIPNIVFSANEPSAPVLGMIWIKPVE